MLGILLVYRWAREELKGQAGFNFRHADLDLRLAGSNINRAGTQYCSEVG
jgi:hypothetical protein